MIMAHTVDPRRRRGWQIVAESFAGTHQRWVA